MDFKIITVCNFLRTGMTVCDVTDEYKSVIQETKKEGIKFLFNSKTKYISNKRINDYSLQYLGKYKAMIFNAEFDENRVLRDYINNEIEILKEKIIVAQNAIKYYESELKK